MIVKMRIHSQAFQKNDKNIPIATQKDKTRPTIVCHYCVEVLANKKKKKKKPLKSHSTALHSEKPLQIVISSLEVKQLFAKIESSIRC